MRTLPPYLLGDTVYCYFDTYDSSGGSATITGLAVTDIEVYKNGSMTQRASDNGYTLLDTDGIDLDGTTGFQGFSIDTSNNSDAGFWVAGHYAINVAGITIDGQTVNFSFDLKLWSVTAGLAGTDLATLITRLGTPSDLGSGANVAANLADIESQTDDIGAAGAGLTALATAAELAKVPKSDSNVTWNATAAAQIQSEANDALVAYAPPTLTELAAAFTEIKGATWSAASDTLEHIRNKETDIETDTNEIGAAGAGLTALASAADLAAAKAVADAIQAVTDLLPDAGALDDLAAILAIVGTTGVVVGSGSKTGYALADDGISAAAIATAAANKLADIILRRGNANAEASSFGETVALKSLYGMIAMFTNGMDADTVPGTMSVKKAGGTELGTLPLTGDAAATPVVKTVA